MKAVWGWVKRNKLATFLAVVLFLLVLKDFVNKPIYTPRSSYRTEVASQRHRKVRTGW